MFQQPVQLSLQEVILTGEVYPHYFLQLPQLQRLVWEHPRGDVSKIFNKFQTITELGLIDTYEELAKRVLQKMGLRLRKLFLRSMSFSVPELLQLCPNLEYVCFASCQFQEFSGSWPSNFLCSLKEANVHLNTCNEQHLPTGFI